MHPDERPELTREEQETLDTMTEYVNSFIDNRFPNGLNGDIRVIVHDIILNAFHDGARWCEQQIKNESRIIV